MLTLSGHPRFSLQAGRMRFSKSAIRCARTSGSSTPARYDATMALR